MTGRIEKDSLLYMFMNICFNFFMCKKLCACLLFCGGNLTSFPKKYVVRVGKYSDVIEIHTLNALPGVLWMPVWSYWQVFCCLYADRLISSVPSSLKQDLQWNRLHLPGVWITPSLTPPGQGRLWPVTNCHLILTCYLKVRSILWCNWAPELTMGSN